MLVSAEGFLLKVYLQLLQIYSTLVSLDFKEVEDFDAVEFKLNPVKVLFFGILLLD